MQSTAFPTSASQTVASIAPTDANLDEACRILTLSSSLDAARRFVGLVQDLSSPTTSSSISSPYAQHANIIPYTLSNRYYTADLHFALRAVDSVALQTFLTAGRGGGERRPPAVIFVWSHGEPYTKHIHHLSQALQASNYEPEVCLAVRIPKGTTIPAPKQVGQNQDRDEEDAEEDDEDEDADAEDDDEDEDNDEEEEDEDEKEEEDQEEDNAEIDSTLMSFGFEYVDATQPSRMRTRTRTESDDDDDIDVPGLPRVIDALSTIMWPSMRSATKPSSKAPSNRPNIPKPSSLSPAQVQERTSILEELLSITELGPGAWDGGGSVLVGQAVERGDTVEVAEEEEVMGEPVGVRYGFDRRGTEGSESERPWLSGSGMSGAGASVSASASGTKETQGGRGERQRAQLTDSPTDISGSSPFGDLKNKGGNVSIGFEDDFTGFVEAPMPGGGVNSSEGEGGGPSASGVTGGGSSSASATAEADPSSDAATEPRPPVPIIDFQLTIDEPDWLFGASSPDTQPQQPLVKGYQYPAGYDLGKFLSWRATSPKPGESPHLSAYTEFGEVSDWGGSGSEVGEEGNSGVYQELVEELVEEGEGREGWEDKDEREWEEEGGLGDFDGEDEEDEEGLPSKEEVRQAANRIFGGIVSLTPGGFVFDVDGGMRWDEGDGEEWGWGGVGAGDKGKGKEGNKGKGKEEAPGQGLGVFAKASDVWKAQREREQSQGGQIPAEAKADAGTEGPSAEMKERMRRLGSMAAAADMRGVLGSSSGRSGRSSDGQREEGDKGQDDRDDEGHLEGKGAFDLEKVLHSLQAMKSEIADIEDEDEKRKMAARVALGLIYGLEGGAL